MDANLIFRGTLIAVCAALLLLNALWTISFLERTSPPPSWGELAANGSILVFILVGLWVILS